jgi:hypothetical protein
MDNPGDSARHRPRRAGQRRPGRLGGRRRLARRLLDPAALGQRPPHRRDGRHQASPAGATRLVVIAREVDFTIIDVGPQGDSPGDAMAFTDDLFDQAGRRIGRDQAHCTIMFRGDVLCDASFVIAGRGQLLIHGVGLTFAVTGGTGEFKKARGQMHETFLPTGEFRFAFTLYL